MPRMPRGTICCRKTETSSHLPGNTPGGDTETPCRAQGLTLGSNESRTAAAMATSENKNLGQRWRRVGQVASSPRPDNTVKEISPTPEVRPDDTLR